jgi:type I restriction enzyme S subunit
VLSSENVQRQFRIKEQGSTVSNLNTDRVASVTIPIPPLSEQQSLVDYLDSAFAMIDAMKANAEKALNEAKALFHASLKEMLEPKEGWEEKKIKDIGSVIGGTTPNTNVAEFWDGTLCWISPAELDGSHYLYDSKKKITEAAVKAKSLKLLPEGTVILSSRAPIGKVVINKVPTYCNQGFKCVVCGKEIYNEFLYWWFWGNTQYLNSLGTGAIFKEISKKVVEEILIPVPSLSEQQSIVATLDSLKSKVDRLQANYDKISQECDALKQAILKQVFE